MDYTRRGLTRAYLNGFDDAQPEVGDPQSCAGVDLAETLLALVKARQR